VIDRPPAQGPAPSPQPPPRRGLRLPSVKVTAAVVLVAIALVGSLAYIVYVMLVVEDEQIPLLAAGFAVMGASFAVIAIGTLVEMWHAASRARAGRALLLAIVGGFSGLAAIGCFTFTALATMVWNT
jgi:hypothetical protein